MTRDDIETAVSTYLWIWEGQATRRVLPPAPEDLLDGEREAYLAIIAGLHTLVDLKDEVREIRLATRH